VTLGAWLESRTPAPPPALATRLRAVLDADREAPLDEIPERCLAGAERLLAGLLDAPAASREAALDLLAADALVTYAFEAAGEELPRLESRAMTAMSRIAEMVPGDDGR
jgi:hypothetical protein